MTGLEALSVRPFRPDDTLIEGAPFPADVVFRGNTVVIGDEVVGYAGLYQWGGLEWAMFHIANTESGALLRRQAPLFVYRMVARALKEFAHQGVAAVYVLADTRYEKSIDFLDALGFRPITPRERRLEAIASVEEHTRVCGNPSFVWVRRHNNSKAGEA